MSYQNLGTLICIKYLTAVSYVTGNTRRCQLSKFPHKMDQFLSLTHYTVDCIECIVIVSDCYCKKWTDNELIRLFPKIWLGEDLYSRIFMSIASKTLKQDLSVRIDLNLQYSTQFIIAWDFSRVCLIKQGVTLWQQKQHSYVLEFIYIKWCKNGKLVPQKTI